MRELPLSGSWAGYAAPTWFSGLHADKNSCTILAVPFSFYVVMMKSGLQKYLPHDLRRTLARWKNPALFEGFENSENSDSAPYSLKGFYDTKSIFVHIPKAAGVSVAQTLYGNLAMGHRSIREYQLAFSKKEFSSFYKFTFVRNPWDRLFSAYNFLKAGGMNDWDKRWADENLAPFGSFERFVSDFLNEKSVYSYIHFYPQTDRLVSYEGTYPLDFIGRFETLEEDFIKIVRQLGLNCDLPHKNKTQKTEELSYKDVYSRDMIDKVYKLYKTDICDLDYDF